MKRTHNCGALRQEDNGAKVTLCGWVDRRRDLGGIIFIDLRDKYGKTQIVFNPERNAEVHALADSLRNEFVIAVKGEVSLRTEDQINDKLDTGYIEVKIDELEILNKAKTSPLSINDHKEQTKENDEIRLRYRYLDLRRP